MTEPTRSRGATVRAVSDTSRLHLAPVLDALLALLKRETPPQWIGTRPDTSTCLLWIAPRHLIEPIEAEVAKTAAEGYVLAGRRTFGADLPRVGSLRDEAKNDGRVQEIARLIDAAVRRSLGKLEPRDILNTDRDRAALRKLLRSASGPVPGIEAEAPCERLELSLAEDAGGRRRASALVFLLDEVIDLKAVRTELLHAVRVHRERAGIDAALLGALDTARFEEPEWQLRCFLDFLLGRGLSRVHADVGLELLARVASIAASRPTIEGAPEFEFRRFWGG